MEEKNRLISVIIPTYNRLKILKLALQALERQNKKARPFEIIVIDDGSSDGTITYLENCSFSFPFQYILQEQQGPAVARNKGLEMACGEIILFLNDDCVAFPDLIEQHRNYHQKYGKLAVLGHIDWAVEMEMEQEILELAEKYYFPFHQIHDHNNVHFAYFMAGNLSAPVEDIIAVGGFDEDFMEAAFEDIELGYKLFVKGLPLKYNRDAVTLHFHHLDFDELCDRQRKIAYWLYSFIAKHPEAEAYYPGLNTLTQEIPHSNKDGLEIILSYMGYRGLKKGSKDFITKAINRNK